MKYAEYLHRLGSRPSSSDSGCSRAPPRAQPTRSSLMVASANLSLRPAVLAPRGRWTNDKAARVAPRWPDDGAGGARTARRRGCRGDSSAAGRCTQPAGISAAGSLGQFVDLDALFPALPSLCDRLAEGPDDAARIRALEEWLRERTRLSVRPHVEGIVGAIIRSGGRAPIDALAAQSGASLRQLERHFRDDVGLTPKALSRIVRLQSALNVVAVRSPTWPSSAASTIRRI